MSQLKFYRIRNDVVRAKLRQEPIFYTVQNNALDGYGQICDMGDSILVKRPASRIRRIGKRRPSKT